MGYTSHIYMTYNQGKGYFRLNGNPQVGTLLWYGMAAMVWYDCFPSCYPHFETIRVTLPPTFERRKTDKNVRKLMWSLIDWIWKKQEMWRLTFWKRTCEKLQVVEGKSSFCGCTVLFLSKITFVSSIVQRSEPLKSIGSSAWKCPWIWIYMN